MSREKKASGKAIGKTTLKVIKLSRVAEKITEPAGPRMEAAEVTEQYIKPTENWVIPVSRRLQIIQLNERTCKWPNGDPLTEEFHFCGNDAAGTGPYCSYHSRIAFQPASERRRII